MCDVDKGPRPGVARDRGAEVHLLRLLCSESAPCPLPCVRLRAALRDGGEEPRTVQLLVNNAGSRKACETTTDNLEQALGPARPPARMPAAARPPAGYYFWQRLCK